MSPSRRDIIRIGGVLLAGLPLLEAADAQGKAVDIAMMGNADGSDVWFEPIGVLVRPGQIVRWTNRDRGNSHTATAYHPDNDGRPLRIPAPASPWNSDYLLPEESFALTLTEPGVYDYFCTPHEHAGMAGRIVVAAAGQPAPGEPDAAGIPETVAGALPRVEEIVRTGSVSRRR